MAWFWLIPAFHLPPLPLSGSSTEPVTITFGKSDLDFPIGLGASLLSVQVRFQRIVEDGGVGVEDPPAMVGDGQSGESGGTTGVVETVVGVVGGPTGVLERVEAQPALGD